MEENSQFPGRIIRDNKISISTKLCIVRNPFDGICNIMLLHLFVYYSLPVKLCKFGNFKLSTEVFFVLRSYQNLTVIDIIVC